MFQIGDHHKINKHHLVLIPVHKHYYETVQLQFLSSIDNALEYIGYEQ